MQHVSEFARLAGIHIPVEREWRYYIELLEKSPLFAGILQWASDFERFEREQSVKKTRNAIFERMRTSILASSAYALFNNLEMGRLTSRPERQFSGKEDYLYASVDIVNANWAIFKCFDLEFPSSWIEFCDIFDTPAVISRSKFFRQLIFGHLNPKKNGELQNRYTNLLADSLEQAWPLVAFSNDEVTLRLNGIDDAEKLRQAVLFFSEQTSGVLEMPKKTLALTTKIFTVQNLGEGRYVKIFIDYQSNPLGKQLKKVQASEYYMYFKKYILGLPIESLDKRFLYNDRIAEWVDLPLAIRPGK